MSAGNLENTWIAVTYAMLDAHAHAVGTRINGLLPPIVDCSKELRAELGIPKDNDVQAALRIGYPKLHFKRGVRLRLRKSEYAGRVS